MERPITIEVYSDVVCPWCYIGASRLDAALAGNEAQVTVTYRPFLLDPTTPEAGRNIPEMLQAKYGADPKAMFARVEAAAAESGLALDLSKQPFSYPMVRAQTLLRHAAERGTQRALAQALFVAHFDQAKNVSDPETLAAIATQHGYTRDEVLRLVEDPAELEQTRALAAAASTQGIRGVPFFVLDGRLALSGAQPVAVLRDAIAQAAS